MNFSPPTTPPPPPPPPGSISTVTRVLDGHFFPSMAGFCWLGLWCPLPHPPFHPFLTPLFFFSRRDAPPKQCPGYFSPSRFDFLAGFPPIPLSPLDPTKDLEAFSSWIYAPSHFVPTWACFPSFHLHWMTGVIDQQGTANKLFNLRGRLPRRVTGLIFTFFYFRVRENHFPACFLLTELVKYPF